MVHAYRTPSIRQVVKYAVPAHASAMAQFPVGIKKYAPSRKMGTPEAWMPMKVNFAVQFTRIGTSGILKGRANRRKDKGKIIANNQRYPNMVNTVIATIAIR